MRCRLSFLRLTSPGPNFMADLRSALYGPAISVVPFGTTDQGGGNAASRLPHPSDLGLGPPPREAQVNWLTTSAAPDGSVYRDLNHNGVMDRYEDPRLPVAERVRDLISRMTVE